VFFGAAACVKYRLHPSIDMVVVRLPGPLQAAVRLLNHALVLGLCAFMAWFGARFAIDAWANPSPVLRLPLTWLYGPVAFCFALMALRYLQVLRRGAWAIDADRETNVG
jgi:TRAP-type C4-dicarboxylate transport system permease small subunit